MTLALDIGGTKIAAAFIDNNGNVHHRQETPTQPDHAENILQRAFALARQTQHTQTATRIAISTGGDVLHNHIAYATPLLPGWAGLNLCARFEHAFGVPTRAENDGNCAALAEATWGAARGCSHALTLIVGTGIGAGFVVDGRVYKGASGGELNAGQIFLTDDASYEETIASGALAKRYDKTIQHIANSIQDPSQLPADLKRDAQHLGKLAATCASILDPNCVVIAGSILLLGDAYVREAHRAFVQCARPPHKTIPFRQSTLGANAALLGAALLWR